MPKVPVVVAHDEERFLQLHFRSEHQPEKVPLRVGDDDYDVDDDGDDGDDEQSFGNNDDNGGRYNGTTSAREIAIAAAQAKYSGHGSNSGRPPMPHARRRTRSEDKYKTEAARNEQSFGNNDDRHSDIVSAREKARAAAHAKYAVSGSNANAGLPPISQRSRRARSTDRYKTEAERKEALKRAEEELIKASNREKALAVQRSRVYEEQRRERKEQRASKIRAHSLERGREVARNSAKYATAIQREKQERSKKHMNEEMRRELPMSYPSLPP